MHPESKIIWKRFTVVALPRVILVALCVLAFVFFFLGDRESERIVGYAGFLVAIGIWIDLLRNRPRELRRLRELRERARSFRRLRAFEEMNPSCRKGSEPHA